MTFCARTLLVAQHAESPHVPRETSLVRAVLAPEPAGTLVVGDMAFGIYRVAQVVYALGMCLLARLDPRHVPTLLGRPGGGLPRVAGALACAQWPIVWAHRPGIACDPELPCAPVPGRILYVRLARAGFRPRALYLFTTLLDEAQAPAAELAALYAERWQVEIVHPQMTKPNGGTVAGGGEDVADLDVTVGDNDAVNQEFDECASLLKGCLMQTVADLGTERLERLRDSAQGDVLLRDGIELLLLAVQGLLPTGQLVLLPFKNR